MKICSTCKNELPLSCFNKKSAVKSTLQSSCKECNKFRLKQYYRENPDKVKRSVRTHKRKTRDNTRQLLMDYLRDHPCIDCSETDPIVLQFDHLRDKSKPVAYFVKAGATWKRIMEEIDKCEVVCANCHTRRTFSRLNKCYKLDM